MIIRTAQAIVVSAPYIMDFTYVRLKEIGPEDVVVKTKYTSISTGTERLLMAGDLVEMARLPFPCVPGYETVGEVVEVGEKVPEDYMGKLVYIGGNYGFQDVTPAWGGQSSYILVDYHKAFLLNGIDPVTAVAVAPAATAWHGVELINPQPGELVLIVGQGPIGQLAAQAAVLKGATVAVADIVQSRLDQAVAGDIKINLSNDTLKDKLPGKVDILIEATGKMDAITHNVTALRDRAKVLLLGFYRKIELDFAWPFLKELSFHVSREWAAEDVPAVLHAMQAGRIQTDYLFTHRFPVAQFRDAYETALHDPACLKALLEW